MKQKIKISALLVIVLAVLMLGCEHDQISTPTSKGSEMEYFPITTYGGSVIRSAYTSPFKFGDTLDKVVFELN